MIKTKRIFCIIISVLILVGLFAGCTTGTGSKVNNDGDKTSSESNATNDKSTSEEKPSTGFPIVDNPITLKIMARYRTGMADFKEMLAWQEYEKLTNIKVDWIMVETASATEKRNLALATGDLPDAFLKCNFNNNDLTKYGEEGIFVPLNDLIDKHAPNYKKVINDESNYPGVKKAITRLDGNIYSFIYVLHKDFYSIKISPKMFINKKWMDIVGKSMPTTTDEFYDVLKAFKTGDPNGNGQADEIPWYASGIGGALNIVNGSWGFQNRGAKMGYIDFDEKENKLRFYPADPMYKEVVQFINKIYSEKLLDEEMFTSSLADLLAKGSKDTIGAFALAGNTYVGPEHENDFVGLDCALKGPHGDQMWTNTQPLSVSTGSFVITNKNKYPIETVKWVDYFYSEEGMKLYFLGKEGETFKENPDGSFEYLDVIMKNPDGLDFQQAINKFVPYALGDNPSLLSDRFFKGAETQPVPMDAAKKMAPYGLTEVWTPFNFTPSENERVTALGNDLNSYVARSLSDFITGRTPFTEWDNYITTLNKMGLDEYLKLQTIGYERYKGN